jgi:hypothetical protein
VPVGTPALHFGRLFERGSQLSSVDSDFTESAFEVSFRAMELQAPAKETAPKSSTLRYDAGGQMAAKTKGNGSGYVLLVAVLQLIGALIMWGSSSSVPSFEQTATLVVMFVLAAAFFGIWLWARRMPFPALLTALVLFVAVHALDAIFDPATILRGLLMKIVVIAGLVTALMKAYRKQQEGE